MFSKIALPLAVATATASAQNVANLTVWNGSSSCTGGVESMQRVETGVCESFTFDGVSPNAILNCNATHWEANFYADKKCEGTVQSHKAGPVGCNNFEFLFEIEVYCIVKSE